MTKKQTDEIDIQPEVEKEKKGGWFLTIIGLLIVAGVVLFLFIVTLPFLWWLWLLILGFVIAGVGISKGSK